MNWRDEMLEFRRRNFLSQEAAAELLTVSQAQISRIEKGSATPRPGTARRMLKIMRSPDFSSPFDHIRTVVRYSPHPVFLLRAHDGDIRLEAASAPALALLKSMAGGRRKPGGAGRETRKILDTLITSGAFRGSLRKAEAVFAGPGPACFHTVMHPVRRGRVDWSLHGAVNVLPREAFDALHGQWNGSCRLVRHDAGPGSRLHRNA